MCVEAEGSVLPRSFGSYTALQLRAKIRCRNITLRYERIQSIAKRREILEVYRILLHIRMDLRAYA